MSKLKKKLLRVIVSGIIFAIACFLPDKGNLKLIVFLAAYAAAGYPAILKAIRNILRGQVFDENFLMTIASLGAFFVGEYPEGVEVMLFFQVGELFETFAVGRSRKSIASLMDIRPDFANVKRGETFETVDPEEVLIGDIILVKAGERVPLDGRVIDGKSSLDTTALTGESLPRTIFTGDQVISGCINLDGTLTIEVQKEFGESTVSKILDLVENASSKKAKTENFITKFSKYYTPTVVIAAAVLAVLPPLLIPGALFSDWIYRALTFLVVSCPCALIISIPLGFFGGIGGASKKGILVKGSNYLEALADTQIVVFDKTGTLTKASFEVVEINSEKRSENELLELAAYAESYSNHPISRSIRRAYEAVGKMRHENQLTDIQEVAGHGVKAMFLGKPILAGNAGLMEKENISFLPSATVGTVVYLAYDGVFEGSIVIADEIKADAPKAIAQLKKAGIRKTVMLTGDADAVGQAVGKQLGLDTVYTELLPADKVDYMERLLKETTGKGKLAFVGDGINDAPVLARADIGIAMGGLGSDAAIEAADIVIMTDEPSKLTTAMGISKKTLRIVKQNIILALGVKALVLILGIVGLSTMWQAVFADVGVSVLAILNSVRALYYTEK